MDPVTLFNNGRDLVMAMLVPAGVCLLGLGLFLWGLAKPMDSPNLSKAGVRTLIAGAAFTVAPAVIGMVRNVAGRLTGGGA